MLDLLGFTVIVVVMLVMLVMFILWLTNKVAHGAVTSHFQDAEYILTYHRPPTAWTPSLGNWNGLKARLGLSAETADVKVAVLERLDELIKFFQTTPLVQDPEARETLIDELKGERATWQTQPINDLMQ